MPTLYVVAGPNGCGKSTLTRTTWFRGVEVMDPDALTRDLMAGYPAWAAREAFRHRQAALSAGRTLAVETTLAGSGVLRFMEVARQVGYRVVLHYVSVNSADQALLRIRNRVALGGHDVPEVDVRRWFARSHANLPAAIERADEVMLYDNTDSGLPHREVAMLTGGAWWSAERLPVWAAAAIARVTAPNR
ncbi:MAG: zeta toxin family protein [Rhodospirillales bacterium]|nr:zeta toxin family protein [Rhodospirillales bacterium]